MQSAALLFFHAQFDIYFMDHMPDMLETAYYPDADTFCYDNTNRVARLLSMHNSSAKKLAKIKKKNLQKCEMLASTAIA